MTGATVTMKSSDPTNHNVNFQLKSLNLNPTMAPGATMDVKPEAPERGPGPVNCSIHPWMTAYWLVLDHPYFAVTDKDGNFEIKNVPAGTQKVVVWQEAVSYVTPTSGRGGHHQGQRHDHAGFHDRSGQGEAGRLTVTADRDRTTPGRPRTARLR